MAEEAEDQGLPGSELITGAMEFHERAVREVMTPRPRIQALELGADSASALRLIRESGHSRYPVFEGSSDNLTGFVFARDVYEAVMAAESFDLKSLLRPLTMVPGGKPATALLSEMRRSRIQLAMVVDEHGAVVGLVTLEDLLEVLVGDIQSEIGQPDDELVRVEDEGRLDVDGTVPIHELNAEYDLRLPESAEYVTLAGLVLKRLGSVASGGERIEVPPHHLTVLAVDGRRIRRVRVETPALDAAQ